MVLEHKVRMAGGSLGWIRKEKPNPWIAMREIGEFKVEKGRLYILFREIVVGTV